MKFLNEFFKYKLDTEVFGLTNELNVFYILNYFQTQKENVLISGDTVFYHSYGRTDLPGGNQNKMNKSLTYIYRNFPESKVYPGHDVVGFFLSENE